MTENAQFAKQNIHIFPWIHPVSLYFVFGAWRLGLPSSPIEIYDLGYLSRKSKFILLQHLLYFLENYTWPLPRKIQRRWAVTPNLLEKTKSTFKCIAKIHALEYKANFIEIFFSQFTLMLQGCQIRSLMLCHLFICYLQASSREYISNFIYIYIYIYIYI